MKTEAEFQEFYQATLLPALRALEARRKQILGRIVLVAGVVLAVALPLALLVLSQGSGPSPMIMVIGVVLVGGAIGLAARGFSGGYTRDFKDRVIGSIVRFFDDALQYQPYDGIDEGAFHDCGIFTQQIDRYRGDDLVRGRIGETEIAFSEVHAEYKTTTTDSKGRRQTHWHTIFRGLFFRADFNKNFAGRVVVLPDTAQRLLGSFGQTLQKLSFGRGALIKLEDPEFEKLFVVYGTDQIEARYLLSTSLMRRITDFKQKCGRPLHLAFAGSRIFVAISYDRPLFEPRIFRTLLEPAAVQEYYRDLQLALEIVEDLNLNLRIWQAERLETGG